jgi:hypothetical protein
VVGGVDGTVTPPTTSATPHVQARAPHAVSAAELWSYLQSGGWKWSGCEGGGSGTNAIFKCAGGAPEITAGGVSVGQGAAVPDYKRGGEGYGGGLPLLTIDWVVMVRCLPLHHGFCHWILGSAMLLIGYKYGALFSIGFCARRLELSRAPVAWDEARPCV